MAKRQHNHHIDVETDDPFLTVTIGSDGGVPGGFAKLFNRIIDSESWARLGDAARAVYIPLVRFADHRNQFRVQMGQAALMKYSGLSRSSIKRAIRDLLSHRLIVVIERGGVSEMGLNESNVYQLLVPAASRKKAAEKSSENPPGVQPQTHPSLLDEPSPGSSMSRPRGHERTETGRSWTGDGGAADDPQYRKNSKEVSNRAARLQIPAPSPQDDAAALLEKCGVEKAVARRLAEAFPHARIVDVIATMEWRRARGKCEN
ncbi:MAG TPA: helix-turn-helix domain-containing protein, partial [Tepidisphaeraceae bacterium]|nr:helix-turn-helix domain-containing protein [Tepidisphaeraceae bacterium]